MSALDYRDTALLGYAVHRFKDPYSAWLLRKSGFVAKLGPSRSGISVGRSGGHAARSRPG